MSLAFCAAARGKSSALTETALVLGGAIEKRFHLPPKSQLFGQIHGLREILTDPLSFSEIVITETLFDLELRVLVSEAFHPLFCLPAFVLVTRACMKVSEHAQYDLTEK